MHDVSKPDEARDILATDDLSLSDTRNVLLYLVQRDEENRKAFKKVTALLVASFQVTQSLLTAFTKMAPMTLTGVPLKDLLQELNNSVEAIQEATDLIKADDVIH